MLKKLLKNRIFKRRRAAVGQHAANGTSSKRKRPAESLVEVIIALFVVAMGSATATSLVVNAMQANSFSRDNLIGLNLAVEGIEAMRNVRDTNWLKFGFDKTNCWNLEPGLGPGSCVAPFPQIEEGYYSIDLDAALPDTPTYGWGLTKITNPLELDNALYSATNDQYKLSFTDSDASTDSNDDGDLTNDPDIYVTEDAIDIEQTGTSKFYRMVELTYDTGNPTTAKAVTVVSTVQWESHGLNRVQISTTLTNYLKVKVGP